MRTSTKDCVYGLKCRMQSAKRSSTSGKDSVLSDKPTLPDADALIFTKYLNWQYESELRIWSTLNESEGGL